MSTESKIEKYSNEIDEGESVCNRRRLIRQRTLSRRPSLECRQMMQTTEFPLLSVMSWEAASRQRTAN